MKTYVFTYKKPDGEIWAAHIFAQNFFVATDQFFDELCDAGQNFPEHQINPNDIKIISVTEFDEVA